MEVLTTLCILSLLVNASTLPSSVEQFSGQISNRDIDFTDSSMIPESAASSEHRLATTLSLEEQLPKRLETLENNALLGGAGQNPTYPVSSSDGAAAAGESCGVSSMLPQNCKDAQKKSGIVKVAPSGRQGTPFYVNCHDGWTIIQQRKDGSIDFQRSWSDYKHGFGNINGEFWIGLDKLHELTSSRLHELHIYLEDRKGRTRTAKYDAFAIGGEEEKYALVLLGNYSGDAGDSFSYQAGQKFSTFDRDNDESERNCAKEYNGGWWYKACYESHLNGRFLNGEVSDESLLKGRIFWKEFDKYFLIKVRMMIRPVE